MKTLIILVTYNGFALTKNCLQKLSLLPDENWKIVIADNQSADGTPEKIRKEFPQVTVYELGENRGFGFANNEAFRKSFAKENFDFVCFLNNDTIPSPETLLRLTKDLEESSQKIIAAPLVKNQDGSLQRTDYRFISAWEFWTNAFRSVASADVVLHGKTKPLGNSELLTNDWVNAVCWMMPAKAFQEIGMFDEKIFMYYEDQDFAFRAKKCGYIFVIDPNAILIHLGGGSAKSSFSRSIQHDSSQLYFYGKHFGFRGKILSHSFRALRSFLRILFQLPRCIFSKSSRENVSLHSKLFLFALGIFPCKK